MTVITVRSTPILNFLACSTFMLSSGLRHLQAAFFRLSYRRKSRWAAKTELVTNRRRRRLASCRTRSEVLRCRRLSSILSPASPHPLSSTRHGVTAPEVTTVISVPNGRGREVPLQWKTAQLFGPRAPGTGGRETAKKLRTENHQLRTGF